MIRIAAVGDIHIGVDGDGQLRPRMGDLADNADVLVLAGDLTRCGDPAEAAVVGSELGDIGVPVVAVLGNHDHHAGGREGDRRVASGQDLVIEGEHVPLDIDGRSVGIAGVKGFGGGFANACATAFGEDVMKAFVSETVDAAERLEVGLASLDTDVRIVVTHYSPSRTRCAANASRSTRSSAATCWPRPSTASAPTSPSTATPTPAIEKGVTPSGVRVRNVAQPVLRRTYNVYELS